MQRDHYPTVAAVEPDVVIDRTYAAVRAKVPNR